MVTILPSYEYRGTITDPDRWEDLRPRPGDVYVCTPPKCGTTWTQGIVAMLLAGRAALPGPLADISPWIDAAMPDGAGGTLNPRDRVAAGLEAQSGRRCIKTHTPADGIPLFETAHYIAVYRHPVDLFFSLRNHLANARIAPPDHPLLAPVCEAFATFLAKPLDRANWDSDGLAGVVAHYRAALAAVPQDCFLLLHYADMLRDHAGSVARIAAHLGCDLPAATLAAITEATRIDAMRRQADRFAPYGGAGFWRSEAGFFERARTGDWPGLDAADIADYRARLEALLPDPAARSWLEAGGASRP